MIIDYKEKLIMIFRYYVDLKKVLKKAIDHSNFYNTLWIHVGLLFFTLVFLCCMKIKLVRNSFQESKQANRFSLSQTARNLIALSACKHPVDRLISRSDYGFWPNHFETKNKYKKRFRQKNNKFWNHFWSKSFIFIKIKRWTVKIGQEMTKCWLKPCSLQKNSE